jgi:hypothetical protein
MPSVAFYLFVMLSVDMLNVIMLSVVMLNVIMLTVVTPFSPSVQMKFALTNLLILYLRKYFKGFSKILLKYEIFINKKWLHLQNNLHP